MLAVRPIRIEMLHEKMFFAANSIENEKDRAHKDEYRERGSEII